MSPLKLVSDTFSLEQCNSSITLDFSQNPSILGPWPWKLDWFCCCCSKERKRSVVGGCSIEHGLNYSRLRFVLTRTLAVTIADAKLIICNPDVLGLEKLECNFHFDKGLKAKECIFETGNCPRTTFSTLYGIVNLDYREDFDTLNSTTSAQLLKPSAQLPQDFTTLLDADPEGLSDAVLKCSGVEIPVHKCILSARSPVFATMFRTKMSEAQNNTADIVDVEPDILRVMLKYMYCGQVDGIPDGMETDLLYAADKYRLQDLKQFCIGKMKSTISVDNVLDILVCGELHDESLKANAKEFICKHREFSKLEDMEQWKLLVKDRPGLAIEVLTSVVKYQEGAENNKKRKLF